MGLLSKFRRFSIFKTLYINFRLLPLTKAIKFPILVGRKVCLSGINRNTVKINGSLRTFSLRLGVQTLFPIYANEREASMLRCGSGSCLTFDIDKKYDTIISPGFSITSNGNLYIGYNTIINQHCTIYCAKNIHIGNNVSIGWNTQIVDSDIHLVYNIEKRIISNPFGSVYISNNVWIANSCSVSKGAKIPPFSIVSSGSLINKNYSEIKSVGNLFVGTPALLKRTGLIRLLDRDFEKKIKSFFFETNEKSINVDEKFDYLTLCNVKC